MTYTSSNTGLLNGNIEESILKKKSCGITVQTNQQLDKSTYDTIVPRRLSSISKVSKSSIINSELNSVSQVQVKC